MILNKCNGKTYVGQSKDVYKRKKQHNNLLKQNKHQNKHLQNSYNKYGASAFEFYILEHCSKDNLNENEIFWINYFNSIENGYNNQEGGGFYNKKNIHLSKKINSTGYYRVIKFKSPFYKQNFAWRYVYKQDGKIKILQSVDIDKLKEKVIAQGLDWFEYN